MRATALWLFAGCSGATSPDDRAARNANVLAEDNYERAQRDPALVAMTLALMQEGPAPWLRGTATLFWRDLRVPDVPRAPRSVCMTATVAPGAHRASADVGIAVRDRDAHFAAAK